MNPTVTLQVLLHQIQEAHAANAAANAKISEALMEICKILTEQNATPLEPAPESAPEPAPEPATDSASVTSLKAKWRQEIYDVLAEMCSAYRQKHNISDEISDADIRKMVKSGKLTERYPAYSHAMEEASRRRGAADPAKAIKAEERRQKIKAKRENKRTAKITEQM